MNEIIYYKDSVVADFQNATTIESRIAAIDNIITHLMSVALLSAQDGKIEEYRIDTGQTSQKVVYRDPEKIVKVVRAYESLKTMYINKYTGSKFTLVDRRNFIR